MSDLTLLQNTSQDTMTIQDSVQPEQAESCQASGQVEPGQVEPGQADPNAVDADRMLASIVRIDALEPIVGADRIVVAEIKGWKCVVAKDDFVVGDLAVYYCEDSMPNLDDPNMNFLKIKGIKRIKIMKLRGIYSQGLLGPLRWMEGKVPDISALKEGDDVTEVLQVKKYVKIEELGQYGKLNDLANHFPKDVPKTDEERLQNNINFLRYIVDRNIVITRKEDGCSCSFVFNQGEFSVCGRNFTWLEGNANSGHYFRTEKQYNVGEGMRTMGRNLGIQGEIIGPKVNGNKLELTALDFKVFNIFDIDTKEYLNYDEVTQICTTLGLKQVPLLYRGSAKDLQLTVEGGVVATIGELATDMDTNVKKILGGLINMSNELMYTKTSPAEGIVVKTDDNVDKRVSFKVISQKFTLKHDR